MVAGPQHSPLAATHDNAFLFLSSVDPWRELLPMTGTATGNGRPLGGQVSGSVAEAAAPSWAMVSRRASSSAI